MIESVRRYLVQAQNKAMSLDEIAEGAAKLLAENLESAAHYSEEIESARAEYAVGSDDDIEIDDSPDISESDNGVWVSAWLYMPMDGLD